MVERVDSPMLDRQQRDELVASLQGLEELWKEAAGVSVVQNNIIIEILRVADDACQKGLSATRYVFYQELFQVLMDILTPQVWQNLSAGEQAESRHLGLEVLNCAIDALKHEKEIKKEIVFLPYKASMWDSLESVWQAAYADKEHCNAYVVPIPYADRKPDMTVAEWHCEADIFPDYVPVLDWQEYTLDKLREMQPDVIFIHNPYDGFNAVTSVEPQYYSHNLKQCTDKLVYIPYYVCGETIAPNFCRSPGVVSADYVIVQDENIKAQFEQHYPDGKPPEGKFLALGSPKFDKVLMSKKEDFILPARWQQIIQGKKIVLYNTSLKAALDHSDMVCRKMRYVFDVFKNRQDVALWWRPHPLMEATFRSMRPEHYAEYKQLVAEYKLAGWGIYDDTPELHRAIAYSDCYYGDGSSVVDLYKVTGKPVILQDLLARDRVLFTASCLVVLDNKLWFISRYCNALFCCDKDRHEVELVCLLDDEYIRNDLDYAQLVVCGKSIIIIPFIAHKYILQYDTVKKCLKKIKLPDVSCVPHHEKIKFPLYFHQGIQAGRYVYLFGDSYPAIVEYDMQTGSIELYYQYYDLLSMHFEVDYSKRILGDAVVYEESIFIGCMQKNIVIEFNYNNKMFLLHEVGEKNNTYNKIVLVNNELWMMQNKPGADIIRWNILSNALHTFSIDSGGMKDVSYLPGYTGFLSMVYRDGMIYLFPDMADVILCIDCQVRTVRISSLTEQLLQGCKLFKWFFHVVVLQDVIFAIGSGGHVYQIDQDNHVSQFYLAADIKKLNHSKLARPYCNREIIGNDVLQNLEIFFRLYQNSSSNIASFRAGKEIFDLFVE